MKDREEEGKKKMKKKVLSVLLTGVLAMTALTGCGGSDAAKSEGANTEVAAEENADATVTENKGEDVAAASEFDPNEMISVYSREDGSGTRGAFIELMGIEQKDENGEKVDYTTVEAIITNSTDVMMTSVAGYEYAIGYVSLGSMNDTVKAVKVDGAEATVENIKSGTYTVARPFNIATTSEVSDVASDFINFIMSADGQAIVEDNGYIAVSEAAEFVTSGASGKIVVGGSSSVSPVMEKLIEAYKVVNSGAEIELQTTDSSSGMTGTADGTLDIGMASRELKDSELELGLTGTKIAMDGIAVIVNQENPIEDMSSEDIKNAFTGEISTWSEVQ